MGEEGELFDCKESAINEFLNISVEDIMEFCKRNVVLLSSVALTGVGFLALKQYTAGGVCTSKKRLTGKTVIITGANCGIGKETAKDLAKRGARVIIACRDITKAERAAGSIRSSTGQSVIVKKLDLASLDSVRNFAENILKTEKNIDILINNAGVMACPRWKSEDGYELQFATNHLGHFLLTNLLLDRIKKSTPSRIINVSSRRHTKGKIHFDDINLEKDYDPWKAYDQSKLANVLFTRELHKRLEGSRVSVFSVHPGVVSTNLASHLEARSLIVRLGLPVLKLLTFKDPVQGAQTTIHCAVANIEEDSGKYFSDCAVTEPAPQAKDDEAAERLWELSEEMTKLVKKLDT